MAQIDYMDEDDVRELVEELLKEEVEGAVGDVLDSELQSVRDEIEVAKSDLNDEISCVRDDVSDLEDAIQILRKEIIELKTRIGAV